MRWVYDDGGRKAAGYKGTAGDCVCRAIAIATGLPYRKVYDSINEQGRRDLFVYKSTRIGQSYARTGVYKPLYKRLLAESGWVWTPTMHIGSGCTVHLCEEELPGGTLIVCVSKHVVCVKDGVLHDLWDCSRDGKRCVYGYFQKRQETAS